MIASRDLIKFLLEEFAGEQMLRFLQTNMEKEHFISIELQNSVAHVLPFPDSFVCSVTDYQQASSAVVICSAKVLCSDLNVLTSFSNSAIFHFCVEFPFKHDESHPNDFKTLCLRWMVLFRYISAALLQFLQHISRCHSQACSHVLKLERIACCLFLF